MTNSQQVLQVNIIPFDLKSFFKQVDCIDKVIIFQMKIYFFNRISDDSISFGIFLHSSENEIDLFVIFARRII